MFFLPSLSTPLHGKIDVAAVQFLQQNLGPQRFYTLGPFAPNYGAYFGVASINHNYLPVPRRWTDWVAAHLDPAIDPVIFVGNQHPDPSRPSPADELRRNLAAYEEVGVKYVVAPAGEDPFIEQISLPTANQGNRPLALAAGQSAQGETPPGLLKKPVAIDALGVLIGNYAQTSDGALVVRLCVANQCATASVDLASSRDNAVLWAPLDQPLNAPEGSVLSFSILHQGGVKPVALWESPTDSSQSLVGPEGPVAGFGLSLRLRVAQSGDPPSQVYSDPLMRIYELRAPKPYFEALGGSCRLEPRSRRRVFADCATAATLVRRELFYPGWRAWVGGQPAAIDAHDDLFESVQLPPGRNLVTFRYAPPGVLWAWLAMGLALAGLAAPARGANSRSPATSAKPAVS